VAYNHASCFLIFVSEFQYHCSLNIALVLIVMFDPSKLLCSNSYVKIA
jgi:hypothetical protein